MAQKSGMPTMTPPGTRGNGGAAGTSAPTIPDAATAGATEAAPRGPAMQPPSGAVAVAGGEMTAVGAPAALSMAEVTPAPAASITGTWQTGVTVDALWSINQVRNAFMRVVGVGWVKLYNGSDGAFTALTTLASQARQTGRTINYRLEADGMAHEIYLW
jgi:hypothetical protein